MTGCSSDVGVETSMSQMASSPIIEPFFSPAKAPFGFPLDEAKWREESLGTADSSQASPAAWTWYNKGSSLMNPCRPVEGGVCGGAGAPQGIGEGVG
ncbi:MAG: hypothetical protein ACP5OU_07810 [Methanothrix sp.]